MGPSHMGLVVSFTSFSVHALILLSCFTLATSSIGGNETDRLALLEFKAKITNDHLGVLSSWNETIHFCQWHGVTCGRRHRRVTVLDLHSQNLAGSISPHIGNLSFLKVLYLFNNSFNHEIPSTIGRLRRLRELALFNNTIGGQIPINISSCSNLEAFSIANNQMEGKIPLELGSLLKCKLISFARNYLIGTIPPSLGNLSSLEILSLGGNNLGGKIPNSFGQLKKLIVLQLRSNGLFGMIPPSIYNLSSLTNFEVQNNQIQGNLPSDLGITLPNLQVFQIYQNQFSGSIPFSLSNASNLVAIDIGENKLIGIVPSLEKLQRLNRLQLGGNGLGNGGVNDLSFVCSLTNATNLEWLALSRNNFGGVLPECIGNLSNTLIILDIGANNLFGRIPAGIGNLKNLETLWMFDNRFSGQISPEIGKLQNLQYLALPRNNLSGNIPLSLGNLTLLGILLLHKNNLHGIIPSSLGKCKNLAILNLGKNNLSGTIPPQVISLSSLSIAIDLSSNQLTGILPGEVGNLKNQGFMDFSDNMLFGEIPSSLGSCVMLQQLRLGGNFFHGAVPSSLRSLRGLQELNLSHNNLSGKIPEFFKGFIYLNVLDLSYNNLEGVVPIDGVFKNTSATSIVGNSKLCGGIPAFQLPRCDLKESKKKKLTLRLKVAIITIFVLLGVAVVLSFLIYCWFRKRGRKMVESNSESSLLKVSYQSLLNATDGFSSTNLIGMGSFGSVYKGILDQGQIVAVKVLNLLHRGASKSFIAECEALRNVRHRNLVKVLTACSSIDYHGNDFKALVYDFMVNGSLEEWLHPIPRTNTIEVPRNLNLLQRLNIAIDVAQALDYLHHRCETPIVHCDLKPSNVLLDEEMTGHVSDFGLARFLLDTVDNSSTDQSSSIGLRGTVGYAAPEYGLGNEVSTYGDIYSYGILVLEMFTRKRPTDDIFMGNLNLHTFVKAVLPEQVSEIADPILLQERETSVNNAINQSSIRRNKIHDCLNSVFGIGVACSVELPEERMNINDAVAALLLIRKKLLETGVSTRKEASYAYVPSK